MKSLKKSKQIFNTYSIMPDEEIRQYLKDLRTKFCVVPIDKALNNLSFICMKFYVSRFLNEVKFCSIKRDTYKLKEEVNGNNITFSSKFELQVKNDFKTLAIMN